jgi:hypothetical protein
MNNNSNISSIVITSIFPPTPSVLAWAKIAGWSVTVVGDEKSPSEYELNNVKFIPIKDQERLGFRLASLLPRNHYSRKNIGYLTAIQAGAMAILDTDDDNMPKPSWRLESFNGNFLMSKPNKGFLNIYKSFTKNAIWPRGFPLERITLEEANIDLHLDSTKQNVNVGIWQGLADGDPDVDAIHRMAFNELCFFDATEPIVLGDGSFCPFNSQNTVFCRAVFPLLYLPSTVTFRFTDILRGLVAQPIMQAAGYHLGFHSATVVQDRNAHILLRDFEQEIPCYLYSQKIIDLIAPVIESKSSISENLVRAYEKLLQHDIVRREEISLLNAWVYDVTQTKLT